MSNKATKQQKQLELALAIMKTNHPFSYSLVNHSGWQYNCTDVTPYEAITNNRQIRLEFVNPPTGLDHHNPHNLTPDQVGAGYRLITEFEAKNNIHQDQVETWFGSTEPIGWRKFPVLNMKENWGASMRVPVSCPFHTSPVLVKPVWEMPKAPAGKQWHTDGWKEEDLPSGWRPLLLNEKREDEDEMQYCPEKAPYPYKFIWGEVGYVRKSIFPPDTHATKGANKTRTTRPLPTEPRPVQLKATDIPLGSAIRSPHWDNGEYDMIISVGSNYIHTIDGRKSYKTLMEDKWVIRYPGADKWFPCHKQSAL